MFASSLTLASLTQPTSGTVRRLGTRESEETAAQLAAEDALTDETEAVEPDRE